MLCPRSKSSISPLSSTPLVDSTGRTWRKGGSLWVTLEPEGEIIFQGGFPLVQVRKSMGFFVIRCCCVRTNLCSSLHAFKALNLCKADLSFRKRRGLRHVFIIVDIWSIYLLV